MNKQILYTTVMLCITICFSQNETANWTFGENAGLNFNSGYPLPLGASQLNTTEGCASMSDNSGNLIIYTDGSTVWNKNHDIMTNGLDLLGNDSSTQSAIIIPKPNSDTIYYIFTVDDRAGSNGLRFSEVDLSLSGGLGAVTANKNILLESPITEKLTAVEASNGEDIWVISHRWESNEFVSYLVSDLGVSTTPVVSGIGTYYGGDINQTIGYLKASPNREKVASVVSYVSQVEVFDFNALTGQLTNPVYIPNLSTNNPGFYGCEFSPDSQLLYVSELNYDTNLSFIHQYNLGLNSASSIIASDIIVGQRTGSFGALQQALDGKIYVAEFDRTSMAVITDPNTIGVDCNVLSGFVNLNDKICQLGLPPFIQSYFYATNIFNNTCFGDVTEFYTEFSTSIDAIQWDFGDPASGINNTSTLLNPTHVFSSYGTFNITINFIVDGQNQTLYRSLTITDKPPVLTLDPLYSCETDNLFNLQNAIPSSYLSPDYNIAYFETLEDAQQTENNILNFSNYDATSTNQTIYITLSNGTFSDCFSISTLDLVTVSTPIVADEDVFLCKNSVSDFVTIDVGYLDLPHNQYSFLWLSSLETTPQIDAFQPGEYIVRITLLSSITTTNPEGCYADRLVTVTASSIPYIEEIITNNTTITVIVSGLGDYEYALDNINGPYQNENNFENTTAGNHIVYIRDKNLCGVAEAPIWLIKFPDYFTPNNDGKNDYWQVEGLSDNSKKNALVQIFDRYGKLLNQFKPSSIGWDGSFNGYPMPTNDYWFVVTLSNGLIYKNHFTLKR
ncbi:T9SS type B sorting domain-containing protein [Olleya sp. UBA1516]|uniref:T9SS type B sorting domain-containing protein n=1 Tax=Olleya sp. UBA1516 TaxID=1947013 RepID=UPI0025F31235|nr:T9SS type B sorting domain-containing protein [Olleya sp. UBA1516]|tara:strand:- start:40327 stop:42687 length:2361 start_codon:yes stop_codon:yes gene_type:complete